MESILTRWLLSTWRGLKRWKPWQSLSQHKNMKSISVSQSLIIPPGWQDIWEPRKTLKLALKSLPFSGTVHERIDRIQPGEKNHELFEEKEAEGRKRTFWKKLFLIRRLLHGRRWSESRVEDCFNYEAENGLALLQRVKQKRSLVGGWLWNLLTYDPTRERYEKPSAWVLSPWKRCLARLALFNITKAKIKEKPYFFLFYIFWAPLLFKSQVPLMQRMFGPLYGAS